MHSFPEKILSIDEFVSTKEKYRDFCKLNPCIPLFSKDWWLDTVCGDNWDVLIIESQGKIIATWPIYIKKKLGFTAISQPPLTSYLGIWINYPDDLSYSRRLSFEMDICERFIELLPEYSKLAVNINPELHSWIS